jgi:hypothetical protein
LEIQQKTSLNSKNRNFSQKAVFSFARKKTQKAPRPTFRPEALPPEWGVFSQKPAIEAFCAKK